MLGIQGNANDGPRFPLGDFVDALGESGIGIDIGHDQLLAVLSDPPGNPFPDLQAHILESLRGVAHGDGEIQFVMFVVNHEQRPGVWAEIFRHLFHDRLQDGIEVERRRQSLGHIMEDVELLALPLSIGSGRLRHAPKSLICGKK